MGLMLSVLVFSVGVIEALSCYERICYGYIPLEYSKGWQHSQSVYSHLNRSLVSSTISSNELYKEDPSVSEGDSILQSSQHCKDARLEDEDNESITSDDTVVSAYEKDKLQDSLSNDIENDQQVIHSTLDSCDYEVQSYSIPRHEFEPISTVNSDIIQDQFLNSSNDICIERKSSNTGGPAHSQFERNSEANLITDNKIINKIVETVPLLDFAKNLSELKTENNNITNPDVLDKYYSSTDTITKPESSGDVVLSQKGDSFISQYEEKKIVPVTADENLIKSNIPITTESNITANKNIGEQQNNKDDNICSGKIANSLIAVPANEITLSKMSEEAEMNKDVLKQADLFNNNLTFLEKDLTDDCCNYSTGKEKNKLNCLDLKQDASTIGTLEEEIKCFSSNQSYLALEPKTNERSAQNDVATSSSAMSLKGMDVLTKDIIKCSEIELETPINAEKKLKNDLRQHFCKENKIGQKKNDSVSTNNSLISEDPSKMQKLSQTEEDIKSTNNTDGFIIDSNANISRNKDYCKNESNMATVKPEITETKEVGVPQMSSTTTTFGCEVSPSVTENKRILNDFCDESRKEERILKPLTGNESVECLIKDVEEKGNGILNESTKVVSHKQSMSEDSTTCLEVKKREKSSKKMSARSKAKVEEKVSSRSDLEAIVTEVKLRSEVDEQESSEGEIEQMEPMEPRQPGLRLSEVRDEDPSSPEKAFWLIFSSEYTKAMSKDWHSSHFCCWQCDESLTGQRYVLRDDHPYCIKCYESVFANSCEECSRVIGIDSKDLSYKDKHWHESCFLCSKCRVSLVDKQFGSKADKIYCGNCYDAQFASRCDGCGQIFRAGTKKMEYKTRQWHEQCFCCCVCKSAIGTKSFIPREQEIFCAGCYEEKFATRCVKCNKIMTSGGLTYKNEPWHRECFTCSNCSTSLAGQRFTSREEKPYCADCFGELFAKRCTACCKPITGIGGTKFISFEDRHWHNECFFCAACKTSLVGRGFITDGDDIICPECAKQKVA